MPSPNERGIVHILALLILLAGIVGTVYLVTAGPLKLFPRATSEPISSGAGFALTPAKQSVKLENEAVLKIVVHSDTDAANVFSAKIHYDQSYLKLIKVDTESSFIKNWAEQYFNDPGTIYLTGGVPDPGFQTKPGDGGDQMAKLYFTTLKSGDTKVYFDDASAIYRNSDNVRMQITKENAQISITEDKICVQIITFAKNEAGVCREFETPCDVPEGWTKVPSCTITCPDSFPKPSPGCEYIIIGGGEPAPIDLDQFCPKYIQVCPSPSPSPSVIATTIPKPTPSVIPTPEPTPPPCLFNYIPILNGLFCPSPTPTPIPSATQIGSGDGNGDGKLDLVDLSILLSDFNKKDNLRKGVDMNEDGIINSPDYVGLRLLLKDKGIIH